MAKNVRTTSEKLKLDEYYHLWLLLTQARSAIFKLRHKKVGQYLHPNQAAALVSIWALNGRITPATLARRLSLEPHTVSELIIRMEKKGLVTKKRDRKNATVVRISITKKGREWGRSLSIKLCPGYPTNSGCNSTPSWKYCSMKPSSNSARKTR
jgi:DNA-binding MarR family transcriptional regulator